MTPEAPKVLTNCLAEISTRIKNLGNQVLVLDYTYCILEKNRLKEIKSFYLHCILEYEELLTEFIRTNGNSIELTNGKNIEVLSCNSVNKRHCNKEMTYQIYDSEVTADLDVTHIESWHSFCQQKGLGGFLMTIFYQVSPSHRIGVYLILQDPLPKSTEGNECRLELSHIIKDFLMTDGWSLTYDMASQSALLSILQSDVGYNKAAKLELDNLKLYQDEVRHNGHTLFNILPNAIGAIYRIRKQLAKKYSGEVLIDQIDRHYKKLLLALLVSRIIAGREIEELDNKSICDILTFLKDNETTKYVNLDLSKAGACDFIPKKNDAINSGVHKIFTVLWNLWHNGVKHSDVDSFEVKAWGENNLLYISFSNIGSRFPDDNIEFLLNNGDKLVSQRGRQGGLFITRTYLTDLGWSVSNATSRKVDVKKYLTIIEISIPKPLL